MTTEDDINVLRRVVDDVINGKNLEVIGEVFAPDFVEHEALPGIPPGIEGTKAIFGLVHTGFPDLHAEIDDVVAQGDKVVFRMTWRGTQSGEFMDVPPTGKQVAFQVIDMVRVENGMLAEHWGLLDMMSLMQQIGAIPAPEHATA